MPEDVYRVSVKFSKRWGGPGWGMVMRSIPDHAFAVGMIRGVPAAHPLDREAYRDALAIVRKRRVPNERKLLQILKIKLEKGLL